MPSSLASVPALTSRAGAKLCMEIRALGRSGLRVPVVGRYVEEIGAR